MGLYDREYSRGPEPGLHLSAPQSATVQLVIATGAVYLAQLAFPAVNEQLALRADWYAQPWRVYQLLTYGFLHSVDDIGHIVINMLVLYMFGREIEMRYGRAEFLTFYLLAIVIAGAIWSLCEIPFGPHSALVGASGGISGIFALYALNFPHRQVLFMFVIPMPMWVAALIALAFDASGAVQRSGNVAFTAHLAGAAFGLAYYWFNWRLAPWMTRGASVISARSKPRLRVVDPDDGDVDEPDELSTKVDAILQKIQEQGQDSLTWSERRLLERASRKYQQKRK